jgi:hypothetical protein
MNLELKSFLIINQEEDSENVTVRFNFKMLKSKIEEFNFMFSYFKKFFLFT